MVNRFVQISTLVPVFVPITVGIVLALFISACGSPNGSSIETPTPRIEMTNKQYSASPPMGINPDKKYTATMHTNKGDIVIELLAEEAPITVNNFVFLARENYYDDVVFHRIIKNFMIQGGDPTGTGSGGPGYSFQDEPVTRNYDRGTLAMANAGPNTNGSQFFIMHGNTPLPKNYNIFGQVIEGIDVVDEIADTPVTASATGEPSVPTERIFIQNIDIDETDK